MIARAGIRNVFMPATALRMMRRAEGVPVSLRTLASGGETVGEETAAWCRERFGVRLNEFYGQTEANLADRQLRRLARAARLDGSGLPGARGPPRRRRDRGARRR